ncbi:hypothetical protein GOBAR_DD20988 [Gossypium barbadense]|nr:hypothetical protein GOBAR_DD20988 [Gossypium barbadense]
MPLMKPSMGLMNSACTLTRSNAAPGCVATIGRSAPTPTVVRRLNAGTLARSPTPPLPALPSATGNAKRATPASSLTAYSSTGCTPSSTARVHAMLACSANVRGFDFAQEFEGIEDEGR